MIGASVASKAQGDLADTAVQPGDLGALVGKDKAGVSDLDATGAPSATTWLRGDGKWETPSGGGDVLAANNLSDLDDPAAARANLGIGDVSLKLFGAVGDGVADDDAAWVAFHAYLAAHVGTAGIIPEGTYKISSSPNWCIQGLNLQTVGDVKIVSSHTGNGFYVDGDNPIGSPHPVYGA